MPDPRDVDPEDFDTEPPARAREDDDSERRKREESFDPTSRGDDSGEVM